MYWQIRAGETWPSRANSPWSVTSPDRTNSSNRWASAITRAIRCGRSGGSHSGVGVNASGGTPRRDGNVNSIFMAVAALPDDLAFELRIMRRNYIMRSPRLCKATSAEVAVWPAFRSCGTPHYPGSNRETIGVIEIWIGFCHRFKQPSISSFFGGPSSSARRHRLFIVGVCSRGHFRLACVLHQSECGVRKTHYARLPLYPI